MNMCVTVFLGILVGIVVVAQTLYTSAMEHIKEFGTVKAIGGSNLDIYRILGEQALDRGGGRLRARAPRSPRRAAGDGEGIDLNVLISPGFAAIVFVGHRRSCASPRRSSASARWRASTRRSSSAT